MTRITSVLLGMSVALSAQTASATCNKPTINSASPAGDTSTMAQMKAARDSVQAAVNLLQQYQTCLNKQIATLPAGANANELKMAWSAEGDAAIDAARRIAAQFSFELHKFKEHPH